MPTDDDDEDAVIIIRRGTRVSIARADLNEHEIAAMEAIGAKEDADLTTVEAFALGVVLTRIAGRK